MNPKDEETVDLSDMRKLYKQQQADMQMAARLGAVMAQHTRAGPVVNHTQELTVSPGLCMTYEQFHAIVGEVRREASIAQQAMSDIIPGRDRRRAALAWNYVAGIETEKLVEGSELGGGLAVAGMLAAIIEKPSLDTPENHMIAVVVHGESMARRKSCPHGIMPVD